MGRGRGLAVDVDGRGSVFQAAEGRGHTLVGFGQHVVERGAEMVGGQTARTVAAPFFRAAETPPPPPVHVTGSKLVLFLKRGAGAIPDWQPANLWKKMSVAIVWIEGDKTYTFVQETNPGPSKLHEFYKSSADLKTEVARILKLQNGLSETARTEDLTQRAQGLVPFAAADVRLAREAAFEEFAKCGPAASPVLRAMLKDEKLRPRGEEIVEAMGKAGGAGVGPELMQMLHHETEYWKRIAPALQPEWWNGKGLTGWPEIELLRDRYCKTLSIVRALKGIGYHGDMEAVTDLRDYWSSLPQLNEESRLDDIVTECDALLRSAAAVEQ